MRRTEVLKKHSNRGGNPPGWQHRAHLRSREAAEASATATQHLSSPENWELSDDQVAALELMERTVRRRSVAVLIGNAGTGKTTLVAQHLLPVVESRVCVAAFTHRACGVVRERLAAGGRHSSAEVRTLASLLGFRETHSDESKSPVFDQVEDASICNYDLVVVDEASMAPAQYVEKVLFEAATHHTAVIFVGDDAQLPPVGNQNGAEAPALNVEGAEVARLTKVHRNGGGILAAATRIREAQPGEVPTWEPTTSAAGSLIVHPDRDAITEAVLEAVIAERRTGDTDTFRVLCHTNAAVEQWNALCRKEFRGECEPFVEGEHLISRNAIFGARTAWDYGAKPFAGSSSELSIMHTPELERETFRHLPAFRSLLDQGKVKSVDVWHLDVYCDQTRDRRAVKALAPAEFPALKSLLNSMRNHGMKAKRDRSRVEGHCSSEWWRSYYVIRNLFNHQSGPRYSVTTHKSQGGQWESVFVDLPDMEYLRKKRPAEFQKLLYTAVTRASRNLHILES